MVGASGTGSSLCGSIRIRLLEALGVDFLDALRFLVGKLGKLALPRPSGQAAVVLPQHAEQQIDGLVRHVDERVDGGAERILAAQEPRFVRQVLFDSLLDAGIKKFGVRGRVEEAVEISSVGRDPDIAANCGLPRHNQQKPA